MSGCGVFDRSLLENTAAGARFCKRCPQRAIDVCDEDVTVRAGTRKFCEKRLACADGANDPATQPYGILRLRHYLVGL